MKCKKMMLTFAALGTAGALYAGQGMGPGNCGNGPGQGMMSRDGMQGQGRMGQGMGPGMHRGFEKRGQAMHGRHHRGRGHLQRMLGMMRSQLELSADQKQKIQGIVQEYRQHLRAQRQQQIQACKGQRMKQAPGKGRNGQGEERGASAFMSKDAFDKTAFKKMIEDRWKQRDERHIERRKARLDLMADTMEKIFGVLTPEQRQKLIEFSKKRMGGK